MHKILVSICTGCALFSSATAQAHGLHSAAFMIGLAHPLLGFDHVLAMLAIGVSVAALGVRFRWAAAGVMSLALLVGGFSAGVMQATINIDPMLAATLLMLSLMIVHKRTFSAARCLGLLSVFTFFQGLAHGLEAPSQALLLPFMSGVVLASLGLLVLGMGLGRRVMLRFPRAQLGFGGLLGIVAMGFLFGA